MSELAGRPISQVKFISKIEFNRGSDHIILGIRLTMTDDSVHTIGCTKYEYFGTQLVENDPEGKPTDFPLDLYGISAYK